MPRSFAKISCRALTRFNLHQDFSQTWEEGFAQTRLTPAGCKTGWIPAMNNLLRHEINEISASYVSLRIPNIFQRILGRIKYNLWRL